MASRTLLRSSVQTMAPGLPLPATALSCRRPRHRPLRRRMAGLDPATAARSTLSPGHYVVRTIGHKYRARKRARYSGHVPLVNVDPAMPDLRRSCLSRGIARFGLIVRNHFGTNDLGVVGPTRARRLAVRSGSCDNCSGRGRAPTRFKSTSCPELHGV